jgi:hypothetical protein
MMRDPGRAAWPVLAALLLLPAAAQADVAVRVGGDPSLDACGTVGAVIGLDPRGDNFLSVRSGPGGKGFREIARLNSGQQVAICDEKGAWLGIVYPARGAALSGCGVASPRAKSSAYRGPCRSGWVHRRFVEIIAG